MAGQASFTTHVVDIGEDEVVKRFRSWDRGEHLREWQALTLLASYAPDLAPAPRSANLTSVPPQVRMSRVPGLPMDRLLAGRRSRPASWTRSPRRSAGCTPRCPGMSRDPGRGAAPGHRARQVVRGDHNRREPLAI